MTLPASALLTLLYFPVTSTLHNLTHIYIHVQALCWNPSAHTGIWKKKFTNASSHKLLEVLSTVFHSFHVCWYVSIKCPLAVSCISDTGIWRSQVLLTGFQAVKSSNVTIRELYVVLKQKDIHVGSGAKKDLDVSVGAGYVIIY